MARLSKQQLHNHNDFKFIEEEVDLPEIGGSVLVRTPSVQQRDDLQHKTPDDEADWTLEHTALLFSIVVVDPKVSPEDAAQFLGAWPGTALDKVVSKFAELIGNKEDLRDSVGEFPGKG